jgi:hypothetical protein
VLAIPAGGLSVVAGPGGARAARAARDPRAAAFEPLARHGHELLLVTCGALAELELNGLAAPGVAVLRPGDEVRIGHGEPLFVDFHREPPFVLAGAEHAGSSCPLCRGSIEAGRRVYACDCGALTHADLRDEDLRTPGLEPLDCAVGSCTGCTKAFVTEAGYVAGGGPGGTTS